MAINPGDKVIIILHSPPEKSWGVVEKITSSGIYAQAIDLGSLENWISSLKSEDPYNGLSEMFYPLWRVVRVDKDVSNGVFKSMSEEFEKKTGQSINNFTRHFDVIESELES